MKYVDTNLTGVIDVILDPLITAISWVFQKIISVLFGWLLELFYQILIYIPLMFINTISIIFRFFCGGFSNYIFSDGKPLFDFNTGQVNFAFDMNSPLGTVVMFTLIVSLILFFIFWLLTFRGGAVDSAGKPIKGAGVRLKYIKWPIFMILSVFFLPYILIIGDSLASNLLLWMDGGNGRPVNDKDIYSLLNHSLKNFELLTHIRTNCFVKDQSATLENSLIILSTRIDEVKNLCSTQGIELPGGYFMNIINNIQVSIQTIQKYIGSGVNTGEIITDYNEISNIVHSLTPGTYINSDEIRVIGRVSKNMTELHNSFDKIINEYYPDLNSNQNTGSWNILEKAASQVPGYSSINRQYILEPLSYLQTSWNKNVGFSGYTLYNYLNTDNPDCFYTLTTTSTEGFSWVDLQYCTQGIAPFQMAGIIYTLATGDTNPNNWIHEQNPEFIKKGQILRWILGTFTCWGMIIICYTYCHSAISRTYFIISYWVVGLLYLANGITQEKAAITWYKQIFGKWWSVIAISICFELACFLVNAILPIVTAKNSAIAGKYIIGGFDILPIIGGIFALEAGFQVGYMIYSKYIQSMGTSDGGGGAYTPLASTLATSGQGLMTSTLATAKQYGAMLTGQTAYTSAKNQLETWRNADAKKDKEMSTYINRLVANANMGKTREEMAENGYRFHVTAGADDGMIMRNIKDWMFLKKGTKSGELNNLGRFFGVQAIGLVDENYSPWDRFENYDSFFNPNGPQLLKNHKISDVPMGGILMTPDNATIPGSTMLIGDEQGIKYKEVKRSIADLNEQIMDDGTKGKGVDEFMTRIFGKDWKDAMREMLKQSNKAENEITIEDINNFRHSQWFTDHNDGNAGEDLNDVQKKYLIIYNELAIRNNNKEDVKLTLPARKKLMISSDSNDQARFGKMYAFTSIRNPAAPVQPASPPPAAAAGGGDGAGGSVPGVHPVPPAGAPAPGATGAPGSAPGRH